jgi:nitrogen fixation NifU-like protein
MPALPIDWHLNGQLAIIGVDYRRVRMNQAAVKFVKHRLMRIAGRRWCRQIRGRAVTELEPFYQEIILDHFRRPRHAGLREPFDAQAQFISPIGEDEVTVRVTLSDVGSEPVLADVSYEAIGCSISQASASVMAEMIIGKTVREAMDIHRAFLQLTQSRGNTEPDEDMLGDAIAFAGVSKYPRRIKCALLCWMAWEDATAQALGRHD